jgi:hypothetical protein
MKSADDSSVIIAAMNPDDPDHESCAALFNAGKRYAYSHALSETFSTLNQSDFLAFHRPGDPAIRLP